MPIANDVAGRRVPVDGAIGEDTAGTRPAALVVDRSAMRSRPDWPASIQ